MDSDFLKRLIKYSYENKYIPSHPVVYEAIAKMSVNGLSLEQLDSFIISSVFITQKELPSDY